MFLAYAPFTPNDNKFVVNTSPAKILSRIMEPKSLISTVPLTSINIKVDHCMLSALAILQTENFSELNLAGIRQKTQKNEIM